MKNIDSEYQIYKSICRSKSCQRSPVLDLIINDLKLKGLDIIQNDTEYYLNQDIIPLSANKIFADLDDESRGVLDRLDVVYQTESTNKSILDYKTALQKYSVLIAESQIHGQGRRNKKWQSPLADNIYLSLKFALTDSKNIHFIPLITAIAICNVFAEFQGIDCQIKWPNDIYLDGKKLGGILTESRYNHETGHTVVVGIGLNVNMQSNQLIDQLWTSLFIKLNRCFDRNTIISNIIARLIRDFNELKELKVKQLISEWNTLDCLSGQQVHIMERDHEYTAKALGITEDGSLLVELNNDENKLIKTKKRIYAADVSIMAAKPSIAKHQ